MLDGRLVDLQKRLRFQVEHPNRIRIAMEEQAVLPFAVAQVLLRTPAVGHVAAIGHDARDLRVSQLVFADEFQPAPFASLVFVAHLDFDHAFRMIQRELKRLPRTRQILGMNPRERIFAAHFLRCIAQHILDGRAGVEQFSFAVHDADDVERILRERAEILFAPRQFYLGLPQFRVFRGFLEGAAHGGWQPVRVLFQDIIGRARLEAFNRRLLPDLAGNQDERRVRALFLRHRQRLQAGE